MLERRDGTISVNYPRILRYYSPEPEPGSRCNNTRPEPSSTWADISGAWAACGEEMARDVSWWTAENWVVTICMNQRGGGFLARAEANYHRDVIWVHDNYLIAVQFPVTLRPRPDQWSLVEDGETQTRVWAVRADPGDDRRCQPVWSQPSVIKSSNSWNSFPVIILFYIMGTTMSVITYPHYVDKWFWIWCLIFWRFSIINSTLKHMK